MESVDGEVDGIHAGELVADLDALGLLNSGLGAQCSGLGGRDTIIQYSLHPKIFALVDFCASLLTIRLIRKNCENVIYFAMTCFIIVYILSTR
jgi:hypothetical protein